VTESIADRAAALSGLMTRRLSLRPGDFAATFARARRKLPARLRAEGEVILRALPLDAHPRLAPQVDRARTDQAFRALERHFEAIGRADRRRAMAMDTLALIAFRLLALSFAIVAFLRWQGTI
jgi:hypothetical protein